MPSKKRFQPAKPVSGVQLRLGRVKRAHGAFFPWIFTGTTTGGGPNRTTVNGTRLWGRFEAEAAAEGVVTENICPRSSIGEPEASARKNSLLDTLSLNAVSAGVRYEYSYTPPP
jgi:hypothetical protein